MGREILTQKELRKDRNTLCIGGFLKRIDVAKDPSQAQKRVFEASYTKRKEVPG
jgi:hypothetical protein